MNQATAYQIENAPSPHPIQPHAGYARSWTPERRQRAAERIRARKPWLKATGPKTSSGKSTARMNALKHGRRSAAEIAKRREIVQFLRDQKIFLRQVNLIIRMRKQMKKMKKQTNEMINGKNIRPFERHSLPVGDRKETITLHNPGNIIRESLTFDSRIEIPENIYC